MSTTAAHSVPIEPEPAGDKRLAERRRILKSGQLCFNGRHCSIPCIVRDLTGTGARLTVDGSVSAPDTFELLIELDGTWVDCVVAWRRGTSIGVRFVSAVRAGGIKRKQVVRALGGEIQKPTLRRKPLLGA